MPEESGIGRGAELSGFAAALRDAHPMVILARALERYSGRVMLSVSFGGAGVALAHMLSRIDRCVPVVFIDTGLLFEETYVFRKAFAERYGLNVIDLRPDDDPGPLYETDPDRCCTIRKVEPMSRLLRGYDAWISAIRRDQSPTRAHIEPIEEHEIDGRTLVRVHPLAYWDRSAVWRYIAEEGVPYHPLLDRDYTSLGCWPCTRPVRPGEGERAGRWSSSTKLECGLHTFTRRRRSVLNARRTESSDA